MRSLIYQADPVSPSPSRRLIGKKTIQLGIVICGTLFAEARAIAVPYYLPNAGYMPARYYLGTPNYYGYYYRPWYLSPFRYSYYAASYGWLYPRYYKPYHPYPLGPWCGYYDPWYGVSGYMTGVPYVEAAESPIWQSNGFPPAAKFAGCDYW